MRARREAPCPAGVEESLACQAECGRPAALAGYGQLDAAADAAMAGPSCAAAGSERAWSCPFWVVIFTTLLCPVCVCGHGLAGRRQKLQGNRGLSCQQGLSRHKQVPPTGCPPFIPRSLSGCANPCSMRFITATNSARRWLRFTHKGRRT